MNDCILCGLPAIDRLCVAHSDLAGDVPEHDDVRRLRVALADTRAELAREQGRRENAEAARTLAQIEVRRLRRLLGKHRKKQDRPLHAAA